MRSTSTHLWLAIRLPDLPLTAIKPDVMTTPVVIADKKRVVFANQSAQHAGVQLDMDITTAQLLSGCEILERHPAQEQQALHQLSEQLYHFTPYIDRYCSPTRAQSGLLLEISSCLQLFSGVAGIVHRITECLNQTPHEFLFGLAHSAKAAWLLSFAEHVITGEETRPEFLQRLNALPTDVLFDFPAAQASLTRMGFFTLGDIARQITHKSLRSFKKRLGQEFADTLAELFDIDQDFSQSALFDKPRDIYRPDEWFEEAIHFEYPITLVDQLKPAFENLLNSLGTYLRKRQQQCHVIEWHMTDIYRRQAHMTVSSDLPQSQWQLLYDLTLIQFENKELPFEVDAIRLLCQDTLPMQNRNQILDLDQSRRRKASSSDFAVTIAKLKARLGNGAVYKLSYYDSRVPELTQVFLALAEKSCQALPDMYKHSLRPSWLLKNPELIEERRQRLYWQGYLAPLVGPERIIGDWWREPVARDYYLAKRQDNVSLWIFFNLYDKQWYVQGVFS
ncbi:Y-family DNA polymerase [Cellvibrio sp. ARAG 10.3]|uniref:Y-family DNA polymerase n=1 Tax=Cellvibrio sp. ARAG 10.3 TaxID=3451358 RepID=UPI003F459E97